MRTLLVDNYDSFTYNLFHYVAEVNGVEPVVVRNDDPDWHTDLLAEFDNVIISPGPGTPVRGSDFGICRDIIEHSELPLLGVCLGHQGIAHVYGGQVRPAPEVRHGRLSPVVHRQLDIFAGLPSPFEAVRYHSLVATDLPAQLEAIAWTPDGVLMGLRHRELPRWGVQFHPESIGTAYGHRLLRNFAELTQRRPQARAAASRPATRHGAGSQENESGGIPPVDRPLGDLPAAPAGAARCLRVRMRSLPTRCQDEVAFDQLFRATEHAFWLDSSRADTAEGRFSIMGDASGPLARVATADVWTDTVEVASASGVDLVPGRFLDWIDRTCGTCGWRSRSFRSTSRSAGWAISVTS